MKALALLVLVAGCVEEPPRPDNRAARVWTKLQGATQPGKRRAARMTYDVSRGAVVVYGGNHQTPAELVALGDTYAFDGVQWNPICDADVPPPVRYFPALTYAPDIGLVMAGGWRTSDLTTLADDVWVCDVSTNRWRAHSLLPEGRGGAALLWDPYRRLVMMIGGETQGGAIPAVWNSVDAGNWIVSYTPTFSTGGGGMSVTYDLDKHRVLAFEALINRGGPMVRDGLWQLQSSNSIWERICEDCVQGSRTDTTIVHVQGTSETYLLNGYGSIGDELSGTWILDNGEFVKVSSDVTQRDSVAAAFDPTRDQLVLYGGNGNSCANDDCAETWIYARP
jgi:hypothetical protein